LAGLAFMGLVVSAAVAFGQIVSARTQLQLRRDIPGGACRSTGNHPRAG
jgi:hypothetical protein